MTIGRINTLIAALSIAGVAGMAHAQDAAKPAAAAAAKPAAKGEGKAQAKGLPKRATTVTKELNADIKVIVTAFGGTWPPSLSKK